jgi:hypothetical protein
LIADTIQRNVDNPAHQTGGLKVKTVMIVLGIMVFPVAIGVSLMIFFSVVGLILQIFEGRQHSKGR